MKRGRRVPLIVKQLLIFVPAGIAVVLLVGLTLYGQMYANLEREVQNRLFHVGQIAARQLAETPLQTMDPRNQPLKDFYNNPEYLRVKEYLLQLVNANADAWDALCHAYIHRKFESGWYVFGSDDYVESYPDAQPEFASVLNDGTPRTIRYSSDDGSWYSGLTPIRNASGVPYAVCEIAVNNGIFDHFSHEFFIRMIEDIVIVVAVLVSCLWAFNRHLLLSIKKIQNAATRITEGAYDVEIDNKSRDELRDLSDTFNRMSRQIGAKIGNDMQLAKVHNKFIPAEFLHYVGKESTFEVHLGDHAERPMTILFSDIRGFASLSEKMTADENFSFINQYLKLMGPVIREQNGFIDTYLGTAIMALFPGEADNALRAALAMVEQMAEFSDRHYSRFGSLKLGIGIHTGPVMMGIVGEEQRYQSAVISEALNLSSRLEGLTKQYGVSIIVSDDSSKALKKPEGFELRFLDLVRMQGKQNPANVYELISVQDANRTYKLESRETYKQAFEMYRRQQFAMASEIFRSLLSKCPDDKAVESLTRRALRLQAEGASATWDGIIELREK